MVVFFSADVERHGRPGRIPSSRTAGPAVENNAVTEQYIILLREKGILFVMPGGAGEKPTSKIELTRCKREKKISRSDSFFFLSVSVCLLVGRSAREISLFPDEISVVRTIIRGDFATIIGKTDGPADDGKWNEREWLGRGLDGRVAGAVKS